MACYHDLLDRLAERGYYSYRLSVGSMSSMACPGAYPELLRAIKQTLDPRGVLAPGRYISASGQPQETRERAAAHSA
jgi:FAD/FMN-containing dehydrogenase